MHRPHCLLLGCLIFSSAALAQERLASLGDPPVRSAVSTANSAIATRVSAPPIIDGKEDDEIWKHAQLIESFRQYIPKEDSEPTFRTTAKVAYDDKYLYVFVRAYDPHPDSIIALLSRHDVRTQSEWIKLVIDSYHDKRTGYEFSVNPRGVKRDYYVYGDANEDDSWDGIWDVETRIDSVGWTAEFRIPWDQMRYSPGQNLTMGFAIVRDIARLNERDSWPVYRRTQPGISSQLGELTGIEGLGSPRHLEVTPYVVTKNITWPSNISGTSFERQQDLTGGADLKYGLTSNLTLDGTINPDFGQVESDPAVLNLSNFETFLPERRPFFVEGMGIFHLDMSCNNGACSGLFYSRRIGRQPQLSDGSDASASVTSIIGAAKITGRTQGGLSVGVLDAFTAKEQNEDGSTSEPPTNYFVGRLMQDFRDGQTGIGLMATATNRQNDAFTAPFLRSDGYTAGMDFRHMWANREYELDGYLVGSEVQGSDSAMALTQLSSTHYYQRPGSGLTYDPTATSMSGGSAKVSLSKNSGGLTRFYTGFTSTSPGFEINDLGYLTQAGVQSWSNWFAWTFTEPKHFYRQAQINLNGSGSWTSQGLTGQYLASTSANINAWAELKSGWQVNFGVEGDNWGAVYDPTKTRGGPALYRHPFVNAWAGISGDPRLKFNPQLNFFMFNGSGGHSHGWGVDPGVLITASTNLAITLALHYDLNYDYTQWVANVYEGPDSTYTFAHLDQNTMAATVRVDATFTPTLTLQFYAQPFISQGRYSNWRQVVAARAHSYDQQFAPFAPDTLDPVQTAACGSAVSGCNFDDQQLNINTVLRWEYRHGSTVYLVWTHGRNLYATGQQYQGFVPASDVNSLLTIHPMNTFLIKVSYWLSL